MSVPDAKFEDFEKYIERGILRYLQEHPSAKDTAQGIAKWWVTSESQTISHVQLNKVLENLVTKGVLGKLDIRQGTPLYFLDKRMAPADLKKLL